MSKPQPHELMDLPQEMSHPSDKPVLTPHLMLDLESRNREDHSLNANKSTPNQNDTKALPLICVYDKSVPNLIKHLHVKRERSDLKGRLNTWNIELNGHEALLSCLPWGASAAVTRLEEICTLGVSAIVNLGICAGMEPNTSPDDFILIDQSIRDEGTSLHYQEKSMFSFCNFTLTSKLENLLLEAKLPLKTGLAWSTDAPYRETPFKLKFWQKKKTLGIDMETSAIFAFGKHYKIPAASLLIPHDFYRNNDDGEIEWHRGSGHKLIKSKFKEVLNVLIENLDKLGSD